MIDIARILWPVAIIFIIVFVETRNFIKALVTAVLTGAAAAIYIYFGL